MSPLNFLQRQTDVFSTLQPGTGEWLLSEAEFRDWEFSSDRVSVSRNSRCCKTVLTSLLVHHLEAQALNGHIGLACIYLNHKETQTQTHTNLIGSMWKQLIFGKAIPHAVHALYVYHYERQTRPHLDEFCKALDFAVTQYYKVYFIIDALDECPEQHRHLLLKYMGTLVPHVNIMMTSRPHINPHSEFPTLQILDIYATEDDIHRYLETKFRIRFASQSMFEPAQNCLMKYNLKSLPVPKECSY
ncbi:hypothetical protein FB451DRAFT_1141348 [Mycena latifolia]|nr:hypothetical protein FB451DRAFT_1141348 [Mycena latifolia]